jgi:serine/threonine protein phosphatase PrpC
MGGGSPERTPVSPEKDQLLSMRTPPAPPRVRAPTPAVGRVSNDVSCSVEANLRFNSEMQDAHVMLDPLLDLEGVGYFAVYDGHGGCDAAGYCSTQLHEVVCEELKAERGRVAGEGEQAAEPLGNGQNNSPANPAAVALRRAFLRMDTMLGSYGGLDVCGATATVALVIQPDPIGKPRERTLVVANVGDSRAVLCCEGGKASRVTEEHVATEPSEVAEVQRRGGFCANGRVSNILAVTRAFGDFSLKPHVTAEPFIRCINLADDDEFLIIACDGLWDVMTDAEAVMIARRAVDGSAEWAAEALKREAVFRGSQDNITVMVVFF